MGWPQGRGVEFHHVAVYVVRPAGIQAAVGTTLGLDDPSEEASYFTDQDGEMAFFHASDVAMFIAQLHLISDLQEAGDLAIEQEIEGRRIWNQRRDGLTVAHVDRAMSKRLSSVS